MTFIHQCGKISSKDKAKARKMSRISSRGTAQSAAIAAAPRSQVFRRSLLLTGVSAAALAMSVPGAYAKSMGGWTPVPTAAAVAAAQTNSAEAAAAAQRSLNALQRATAAIQAMQATQQAARDAAKAALAQTPSGIPDGLKPGGLDPVVNPGQWIGGSAPSETKSDGRTKVTIDQTQQRAVFTWNKFNISEKTDLVFNQLSAEWVALNRVQDTAPSTILGSVKAPGTVLVINQNGIVFGGGSQINVGSLIASTLEVGPGLMPNPNTTAGGYISSTIDWRTQNFINNGLTGYEPPPNTYFGTGNSGSATFSAFNGTNAGTVRVEKGATITADDSGLILLTAPHVINAGYLRVPQGQVILTAAELALTLTASNGTGSDPTRRYDWGDGSFTADHVWASPDADVRGVVPLPQGVSTSASDYYVWNQASGLIEAPQGNIYLRSPGSALTLQKGYSDAGGGGATIGFGAAYNDGILSATTSVSRNGSIIIQAGDVRLRQGSLLNILPDVSSETIPQAPSSLAAFRPSVIKIVGGQNTEMESGSLILAPGGNVQFGPTNGLGNLYTTGAQSIVIDAGAEVNVAGLTDVFVPLSDNQVFIDPAKKNELRDTPIYRIGFLNGATIYLDPRVSGVRDDGVAWIGSPLIDATAYYQLVGIGADRLMTKGGSVTFGTSSYSGTGTVSSAIVRNGAVIDISGGWLRYEGGVVRTTQLVDKSGHVVDISDADPNGDYANTYIGIYNGWVRNHPQWGVVDTWSSSLSRYSNGHYMPEFTEGKDAGALRIAAPAMVLDGTLLAEAYAGALQNAGGKAGTGASSVSGDQRRVQGSGSELPAGGALILYPTGDVRIVGDDKTATLPGDGVYGAWDGGGISAETGAYTRPTANAQPLPADRLSTLLISDDLLSKSGLSQVSILSTIVTPSNTPLSVPDTRTAFATITVDAGAHVALAAGGVFQAEGTRIQIDGDITVPSGKILLRTDPGLPGAAPIAAIPTYHRGDFDIVINGDLSVAGRWVNDFGATSDTLLGPGWLDGGTISMVAAPRVQAKVVPFNPAASDPTDVSGSILIGDNAHLNLSGGGRVDPTGKLQLSAKGGNLSLVNESTFFLPAANSFAGFQVPACGYEACYAPSNPSEISSRIVFKPSAIDAHGFGGGGSFTLTTPEFSFGTGTAEAGAMLPLDFFSTAGFANYNITSYKTALIPSQWIGYPGTDAVLAMQTLTIGAGQNLSLVQSVLPTTALTASQSLALRDLASGSDIRGVVTAYVPSDAYEQKAVNLTLGGAMEIHVAQGGSITGAPGSSLTVGGLVNEGLIRISGGTVAQKLLLNNTYVNGAGIGSGIGIRNYSDVFSINPDGTIDPNAPSKVLHADGSPVLNKNLVGDYRGSGPLNTNDARGIYFLGMLDQNEGIVLAPGSVTDLSGAVLRNPLAEGRAMTDGRLVGGGALVTSAARAIDGRSYVPNGYQLGQQLVAQPGAIIDLSGAAGTINQPTANGYAQMPVWSNGGTLSLGAGGTLSGAIINAHGGNEDALGGTLQIFKPIFAQHDSTAPSTNVISSDLIDASGFSTVVAVGGFNSSGDATINLDRGLFVVSAPWTGINTGTDDARANALAPVISSTGALTINAPYVGLLSTIDDASSAASGVLGNGVVTLHANQIDVTGTVRFDNSVLKATLWADGDVRLIGVDQSWKPSVDLSNPTLKGALLVRNDLEIRAGQIYPTTGSSFVIASPASNGTIAFTRSSGDIPAAPYTAGGSLTVQAANIVQAGVLRVPFGTLTLGGNLPLTSATNTNIVLAPATKTVTLADGSITSVSANGLSIPYGTTTDTIEWYFAPTNPNALSGPPVKVMRLAGDKITLGKGATVDLSGGGDLYGYEFVPGTGGSRDVLSQFNSDQYSANFVNGIGYQYPDGRQVYAIVPGLSDKPAAVYDPIYSANYAGLLSASGVGRRVYLSGGNGLAAGWYTLLPAQYAMLPGGMRVVEQIGANYALPNSSVKLADGTLIVSGRYGDALSGAFDSQFRQFSVMTQDVIKSYSNIVLTSGNDWTLKQALASGEVAPRVGLDAGRLILAPLSTMTVDATMRSAPSQGGRGSQVDIAGTVIDIVSTNASAGITPGSIVLSADSLNNLQAESLLIGGTRTDNNDGTTTLSITSTSIVVANDSDHALKAPEIVLTVDDGVQKVNGVVTPVASRLELKDGATINATGLMNDQRNGAYIIDARVQFVSNPISDGNDHYNTASSTGIGAFLRVANGPQRLVQRLRSPNNPDLPGVIGTPDGPDASLIIGNAHLTGNAIALDTSHALSMGNAAQLVGKDIALGGSAIAFSSTAQPTNTIVITPELLATLSQGQQLTLRSQTSIGFDSGDYQFNSIRLDAATLKSFDGGDVVITADKFELGNVSSASTADNDKLGHLTVNAGEIVVNTGTVVTSGFGGGVALKAAGGMFSAGKSGVLDVGAANLSLTTPYIGDRGIKGSIASAAPAMTLKTEGDIAITSAGTQARDLSGDNGISGSSLTLDGRNVSISGTRLRATSGVLSVRASGGINLSGGATLTSPSFAQTYGDSADPQTKFAPGGMVSLASSGSAGLSLGDATLSVGNGSGNAGTLKLSATNGAIDWGTVSMDGKAGAGGKGGIFSIETIGGFDLVALNAKVGADGFTGGYDVRTKTGDLVLGNGQVLKSGSVNLTADGGTVVIGGTIDTAGTEGGDIALYGARGVTLESTSKLYAYATGYATDDTRQASAGNVTLGTSFAPGTSTTDLDGSVTGVSGNINVAAGAMIDVSAKRQGDRLVRLMRNGTINYAYVQGDRGGVVTFRAPVKDNGIGGQTVDVRVASASSVIGSREIDLVGFKSWDLAAVATSNLYAGVTRDSSTGAVTLDVRSDLDTANLDGSLTSVGRVNFLGDYGAGSVAQFAQDFNIATAYGNLGGLSSQPGFTARPGVDLTASGDIVLASNWNLGAGSVNLVGAAAAGDMALNPRLVSSGIATSGYIVVPGREGDIIDRFTRFTYRPGRSARAGAPVVSLLAGGTLDLRGSVTDGFFTFRDQTDPAYRNQNGATYNAYSLTLSGGINNGSLASAVPDWSTWSGYSLPTWYVALSVGSALTTYLSQSSETIDSTKIPYSAAGNSPAALGNLAGGAGDAVASAQIFPLLPDGAVVASSSYNLVAGAALGTDPGRINPVAAATLKAGGYTTYQTAGGSFTTGTIANGISVDSNAGYGTAKPAAGDGQRSLTDWLAWVTGPTATGVKDTSVAALYVGNAAVTQSPARALVKSLFTAFLAEHPELLPNTDYRYSSATATLDNTTFIAMPVSLFRQFVENKLVPNQTLIEAALRNQQSDGSFSDNYVTKPTMTTSVPASPITMARSLIRTGTGEIHLGAAGDVDLTGGPLVYVTQTGAISATTPAQTPAGGAAPSQVGGVPVYTAGHPVAAINETLADPLTGDLISVVSPAGTPAVSVFASPRQYFTYGLTVPSGTGAGTRRDPAGVMVADTYELTGGGDVTVAALGSVLSRRDLALTQTFQNVGGAALSVPWAGVVNRAQSLLNGLPDQAWRIVSLTTDGVLNTSINPQLFREGLGALGGGNIHVQAGGNVSDITTVVDTSNTSVRTALPDGTPTNLLVTVGGGDIAVHAEGDITAARIQAGSGAVHLSSLGNIGDGNRIAVSTGFIRPYFDTLGTHYSPVATNYLTNESRIVIDDATVDMEAGGTISLAGIGQLSGFYSDRSALNLLANGNVAITNTQQVMGQQGAPFGLSSYGIYPGTLTVASITGDIDLKTFAGPPNYNPQSGIAITPAQVDSYNMNSPAAILLVPSPDGQLSLLAGHNIGKTNIAMLDADPYYLPGLFSLGGSVDFTSSAQFKAPNAAYQWGTMGFPSYSTKLTDTQLRRQHNATITHANDLTPAYVYAGNDIGSAQSGVKLWLPKQARIYAGRDLLNMMFFGQNLNSTDITRIVAGRDITATSILGTAYLSQTTTRIAPVMLGNTFILGGPGDLMIEAGRNLGPFLNSADISDTTYNSKAVLRYPGGIATIGNEWNPYLPGESANITVQFGVAKGADYLALRDAYVKPGSDAWMLGNYGAKLLDWMKTHARDTLIAKFGTVDVSAEDAYATFIALPELRQRHFLLNEVYFNELRAPADPTGPSYLKYSRGYTVVNTLFPASLGYTANGLDGGDKADMVHTGDLDLRLATIETLYGGGIDILGPGGRVVAGSVVSTAQQITRRNYTYGLFNPNISLYVAPILAVPTGYEGVLTQRGGAINTFTDGDFLLNQSRLFTVDGDDITMWSSNADLNGGQGAKTTPNFPPVLVRLNQDLVVRDDRTGSTTGAGIAAFPSKDKTKRPPVVSLEAPRGTVDAGDAGVRSAGDINVAALTILNADNFRAAGNTSGIPTVTAPNIGGLSEASNAAGQAAKQIGEQKQENQAQPSIIIVEVLGFGGGSNDTNDDEEKKKRRQ